MLTQTRLAGPPETLTHPDTLKRHLAQTLRIGLPLAGSLLAQMAMGTTDTIMLGALGPDALAAGGLGTSIEITVMVVLQGVLSAVSILVAQARGAARASEIPALYWTGMLLALLLIVPAFILFGLAEPLLLLAGEPPDLSRDVGAFVSILRWCIPGAMIGMGLMRAFLPAIDAGWIILPVTLVAVLANAALCYGFIHGAGGLPEMGQQGAAMATAITMTLMAAALLLLTHASPSRRTLVRWSPPRPALIRTMLRLGLPIGATFAVETGLFFAVALLIGTIGAPALAAHQVALTTISAAFMVPLGLAQAANVRVGHCVGARNLQAARRAGLVAIALAAGFEFACAIAILLRSGRVVALYLGPAETEAAALATTLLGVAALFQVADGVQCVAAGALRGLGDTRIPFALAAAGYWGLGFPLAWWLCIHAGWGAVGAWCGLAAGLGTVATLLTLRFIHRASDR